MGAGLAVTVLLLAGACTHDFYETGDSGLSYLHADFVEAATDGSSAFTSAATDDGTLLTLRPAMQVKWAARPDTVYRALLYYNKVEKGVTEPVGISLVPVLRMRLAIDGSSVHTDPVAFESAWVSRNRRYLNLGLSLKTGKSDDESAVQSLAAICDSVRLQPNGGRTFYLRLYHDQNGVPEYYSSPVYASIPLTGFQSEDSVILDVNTYKGVVRRRF